jgi:hypothetical protein
MSSSRNLGTDSNQASPEAAYQHPLSFPRTSTGGTRPSTESISKQRSTTSGFSFELYDPDEQQEQHGKQQQHQSTTEQRSRQNSALSPTISSMLDESVWVDSLRRGATMRQSRHGQ